MLSKKETSFILDKLMLNWPENTIPKIKNIKAYEIEKNRKLLIHEGNFAAVLIDEIILPFLGNNNLIESFPYVLIDMGAVRYVCNGANIARPGIIKFEILSITNNLYKASFLQPLINDRYLFKITKKGII